MLSGPNTDIAFITICTAVLDLLHLKSRLNPLGNINKKYVFHIWIVFLKVVQLSFHHETLFLRCNSLHSSVLKILSAKIFIFHYRLSSFPCLGMILRLWQYFCFHLFDGNNNPWNLAICVKKIARRNYILGWCTGCQYTGEQESYLDPEHHSNCIILYSRLVYRLPVYWWTGILPGSWTP